MAEKDMIERCKVNDRDAWDTLIKLYWRDVYNLAFRMVFDVEEAKDITQEIFIKLVERIKTFDEKRGDFKPWLMSISRNYIVDCLRRRNKRKKSEVDVELKDFINAGYGKNEVLGPDEELRREEKKNFLRVCLNELKEEYKMLIVMRDIENLSYEEMSNSLKLPLGTVKSRLNRARIELAKLVLSRKRNIGE